MNPEPDSETISDPFQDASSYYFTVDEESLGEEYIEVHVGKQTFMYDRVHIVLLGGAHPIVFGMYAVQDATYIPADTFPLEQVRRIENPTNHVERYRNR